MKKPRELLQRLGIELIKNKLGKNLLDRTKVWNTFKFLIGYSNWYERLKDEINYF